MRAKKQGPRSRRGVTPEYAPTQDQLKMGADPRTLRDIGYPVDEEGYPDHTVDQLRIQRTLQSSGRLVPNLPDDKAPPPNPPLHIKDPETYVEIDEEGIPLDGPFIEAAPSKDAEVLSIDSDVAFAPDESAKTEAQNRHPSTGPHY